MRKLTEKQKKYVLERMKGENKAESVIRAGYNVKSREVASILGVQMEKTPSIKIALSSVLDAEGLTDDKLARYLYTAIDTGAGKKSTNADALKGIELALKLKGYNPSHKVEVTEHKYIAELKKKDVAELRDELIRLRKDEGKFLDQS